LTQTKVPATDTQMMNGEVGHVINDQNIILNRHAIV
jgi:hypothetical protein